jgi:outer membrane translocation and assembly module TamA
MIAGQAEYRWRFYKKWGAVAFAGIGSIWGNDNEREAFERKLLPSVGTGLRYMISPEKRINLRLDYAVGVDGNQGLYFGVMEAF